MTNLHDRMFPDPRIEPACQADVHLNESKHLCLDAGLGPGRCTIAVSAGAGVAVLVGRR